MKRLFLIFSVVLCTSVVYAARPQERYVHMDTVCRCSQERFQQVINKFFYQFQTGSDSLFMWAYLNTDGDGDSKEGGKDAMAIHYTYATYDPVLRKGDQAMDIYVFGSKMFPDRHLITVNHGKRLSVEYTGKLLDDASIVFHTDSVAPHITHVHYEFNLVFGKLVSLLVSDKLWQGAMQWRLEQVFKNLVEYAETGTVTNQKEKEKETTAEKNRKKQKQ